MSNEKLAAGKIYEQFVDVTFLVECFGISERTILRYADKKALPRNETGKYPLYESLLWFINKQKEDLKKYSEENPYTKQKIQKLKYDNLSKWLDIQAKMNVLVDAEKSDWAMSTIINYIFSSFNNLEKDIIYTIQNDKTLLPLRKKIEEGFNEVRDVVSKYNIQKPITEFISQFQKDLFKITQE